MPSRQINEFSLKGNRKKLSSWPDLPASRGALLTAAIFLYEFMGLWAGYYAGRLYKTMKGKEWKKAAFSTATLYPGMVAELPFS